MNTESSVDATTDAGRRRPRVLILGGGFAGIGAARKLKDADAEVVLVDAHDYHTFQPLLYQVATDLLPESTVGHALRDLFHDQPNARVHTATVTGIDVGAREVRFAGMEPVGYDYLVVALGAGSSSSASTVPVTTHSRSTRSRTRSVCASTSWSSGRRPTAIRRSSTTAP